MYHMTYNMVGYSIQYEVSMTLSIIWYTYDIQYGGVLYPVWSKTSNISYDIQYGGELYPVWSKTGNISYVSYDIQYGGVLYPVCMK